MPLDQTGKEITIGSFVSFPKTATKAGYGIVTGMTPSRARINEIYSKPFTSVFVITVPDQEANELRNRFQEALNRPMPIFRPRYAICKFVNSQRNGNPLYVFMEAEDGSGATASYKLEIIRANLLRDTGNAYRFANYVKADNARRLVQSWYWQSGSLPARKAIALNIAQNTGLIATKEQLEVMGFVFP